MLKAFNLSNIKAQEREADAGNPKKKPHKNAIENMRFSIGSYWFIDVHCRSKNVKNMISFTFFCIFWTHGGKVHVVHCGAIT